MKRAQLAWILYDVSSSGYVLLITAVAFPIYFKIHGTGNAAWSDALWGSLLAFGSILAAILGPVAGAAADLSGKRLRYLYVATAICCISTALLGISGMPLPVLSGIFVVSYVAYLVAANLYDSLLSSVTTPDRYSWLSGMGWGFGYIGGIVCYLLSARLLADGDAAGDGSGFAQTFLVVAIYYATLAAISVACMSHARSARLSAPEGLTLVVKSARQVAHRLRSWRFGRSIPKLLVGANLITGAATALTLFTPLMLSFHFGLSLKEVTFLSALFSILSIPTTLLAGIVVLKFPALALILTISPLWLVAAALLAFGTGWHAGLAVAICLGLIVGPTNATARAIIAHSIASQESGEMFGFAAFVNRLTAALGPMFFGVLSSASSNRLLPIAVAGAVIVVGLYMLAKRAGQDGLEQQKEPATSAA